MYKLIENLSISSQSLKNGCVYLIQNVESLLYCLFVCCVYVFNVAMGQTDVCMWKN